jgi:hypothetical protein
VAYLADQDIVNLQELYSSRPDGSDNLQISVGAVSDLYDWVP